MIAIIADIHANRPALREVLAEARRRGATRLVVLGDVVGYYAEPDACVELLAAWPVDGVCGNHDLAALGVPDRHAGRPAAATQAWTAEHLGADARRYLASLPRRLELPWALAVHASFTHPDHVVGYVTAQTADANLAALAHAGFQLGLCGHSHVPSVFTGEEGRIVNPGSVGQPRDGDPRASFVMFDPEVHTVELVRIPYDIEATVRALRAAGLHEALATRLYEAR